MVILDIYILLVILDTSLFINFGYVSLLGNLDMCLLSKSGHLFLSILDMSFSNF
jgi:hypothetical protein